MSLSAEDRCALLLGRAIHRAEVLQVRVEQLEAEKAAVDEEVAAIRAQLETLLADAAPAEAEAPKSRVPRARKPKPS